MSKDYKLNFERLDSRVVLSSNPWYVDAIKADTIWNNVPKSSIKPIVAIVDSGLDFNHPDLKNDIWTNPLEIANNKDDDNNGYIDDIHGWDFVDFDNSPVDGFYHGTHVAGIIDTVANSNVSLLPVRFMNNAGVGYASGAANAINYVVSLKLKGANIVAINCSFGGLDNNNTTLASAIKNANDNGIIVVLAAGNNGVNMDINPKYPGSLRLSNSITVGAINPDLSLASYSNYGKNSVTVASPGTNIYSTLPNSKYGYISGTSMATAVVSGSVGLLKTIGNYTSIQIKNAIIQGCDAVSILIDKIQYGLINVAKSWNILIKSSPVSPPEPAPIVNKLIYGSLSISNRNISGWASISNSTVKPVVEVYINNTLRYSTTANQYRTDTKSNNGFAISISNKLLGLRSNRIIVKIKNPITKESVVAYDAMWGRWGRIG